MGDRGVRRSSAHQHFIRIIGIIGANGELFSCYNSGLRPYSPSNGFRFQTTVVEYVHARTIRRPPHAGAVLRL